MITNFEDFCLWMYVLVDDLWPMVAPGVRRPGPPPVWSDSELITMVLIGECRGWDVETELVSQFQAHRDLFPVIPERSRFNRRRRNLMWATNNLRRVVLELLDLAHDRQCAIDSLPIPVIQFHLVPSSSAVSDWKAAGAAFGKVPSKQQTIFGYKLHLLVTLTGVIRDFTLTGVIRDFTLAGANVPDLTVGADLLVEQQDLDALGDKASISAPVADDLASAAQVTLLTLPRRNQRDQRATAMTAVHNHFRQVIETVNDQLAEQFHIEQNHAHTFWGLCARLYSKLTAHTLCVYLNWLLGNRNWLRIKALAFPN